MESQKIKGNAKSFILDNGIELTYYELGEKSSEVLFAENFSFIHLCR